MSGGDDPGPERIRLHGLMVIGAAEAVVAEVRMADLVAAQNAARRRHIAAKGQLTRARRHGGAEKIAAAEERERQAYAEFARVSDVSIEEMLIINAAGLERLAELLGQMERARHVDP